MFTENEISQRIMTHIDTYVELGARRKSFYGSNDRSESMIEIGGVPYKVLINITENKRMLRHKLQIRIYSDKEKIFWMKCSKALPYNFKRQTIKYKESRVLSSTIYNRSKVLHLALSLQ